MAALRARAAWRNDVRGDRCDPGDLDHRDGAGERGAGHSAGGLGRGGVRAESEKSRGAAGGGTGRAAAARLRSRQFAARDDAGAGRRPRDDSHHDERNAGAGGVQRRARDRDGELSQFRRGGGADAEGGPPLGDSLRGLRGSLRDRRCDRGRGVGGGAGAGPRDG